MAAVFKGNDYLPLKFIFLIRTNQSSFFLLNAACFGLTRPGLEPTIYRTQGKYANHYATDAISYKTNNITRLQCSLVW
jgi:hypothetical protein